MGKFKKVVHTGRRAGKDSLRGMLKGAMKAGYYDPDIDDVDYDKMARDRKWLTKDGKIIPYARLTKEHLVSILLIFEDGKFRQRKVQHRGLKEELLSRESVAGKVLYGTRK